MDVESTSETLVNFTRLHVATTQKTNSFKTNIVCFREESTGANDTTPEKVSWVRVLVKMVFCTLKTNCGR
jgi:hypothetical protein